MMQSRKNRKGSRRGPNLPRQRPQGAGVLVRTTHPPPIKPQASHRQRMRFLCATSGTLTVSFSDLLDCLLIATTATQVFQQYDFVRVRLVEVWCASVALGTPITVGVQFNGGSSNGLTGDGRIISDTSMSQEPAHVRAKPDSRSQAGQWNTNNATSSAFTIVTPAQAIIDVECDYRNEVSAPTLAQNVAVGATIGQFYYRGLDALAFATTKYTPITGAQAADAI
jgi:hypothetical protein